jgi:hypothetical protein
MAFDSSAIGLKYFPVECPTCKGKRRIQVAQMETTVIPTEHKPTTKYGTDFFECPF